jgi:hypothetical protein
MAVVAGSHFVDHDFQTGDETAPELQVFMEDNIDIERLANLLGVP